jgi:hypothetical protein
MTKHVLMSVVVAGALVTGARATPVQVSQAFLLSEWSAPSNEVVPPFTFVGTSGVQLTLDGSGLATGQSNLIAPVSVSIDVALKYWKHTGTINHGEGVVDMAGRVNSEIGRWDDAGVVQDGTTDAPLNVDFGDNAKLFLQKLDCPIPYLLIAEDAGLDPFKLWWDADGDFSSGAVLLFAGFNTATKNAILARPDFGSDDKGLDVDQVFLFLFADPLPPGYLKIQETSSYGGSLLEIDFIGSRCIPEPTTAVTVGMGIGWMVVLGRRRR